jgi:hypothetical protein
VSPISNATALFGLNGFGQSVDQLLLLSCGQLCIGVEPQEIAWRHIPARYLALDLLVEGEAIRTRESRLPVVKIERLAPLNHITGDQPRGWRDRGIPRPSRLIAVTVIAGTLCQRLRFGASPLRL